MPTMSSPLLRARARLRGVGAEEAACRAANGACVAAPEREKSVQRPRLHRDIHQRPELGKHASAHRGDAVEHLVTDRDTDARPFFEIAPKNAEWQVLDRKIRGRIVGAPDPRAQRGVVRLVQH